MVHLIQHCAFPRIARYRATHSNSFQQLLLGEWGCEMFPPLITLRLCRKNAKKKRDRDRHYSRNMHGNCTPKIYTSDRRVTKKKNRAAFIADFQVVGVFPSDYQSYIASATANFKCISTKWLKWRWSAHVVSAERSRRCDYSKEFMNLLRGSDVFLCGNKNKNYKVVTAPKTEREKCSASTYSKWKKTFGLWVERKNEKNKINKLNLPLSVLV